MSYNQTIETALDGDVFEWFLEMYSLEDILEMNDIEPTQVLTLLYNEGMIKYPEVPITQISMEIEDDQS